MDVIEFYDISSNEVVNMIKNINTLYEMEQLLILSGINKQRKGFGNKEYWLKPNKMSNNIYTLIILKAMQFDCLQ